MDKSKVLGILSIVSSRLLESKVLDFYCIKFTWRIVHELIKIFFQWTLSIAIHGAVSQGQGKAVFAITDEKCSKNSKQQSSRQTAIISTQGNNILIHALLNQPPPSKSALTLPVNINTFNF